MDLLSPPEVTDMTYKNFSTIIFLFAVIAMTTNVNAGIVALYDANVEIAPQPLAGDQTNSVVNTSSTTNGVYNTRSIAIGGTSTPHRSGIVPSNNAAAPPVDGHFYVQSSVTLDNHNIIAPSAAYQEFSIQVDDPQLNLDTLSFNYWATEGAVNDPEGNTDYTYSVRAHAEVIGANGSSGFQNLGVISGNDSLQIQNSVNNNLPLATSRSNVVTFDLLSQLGTLNQNDVVNFRLSFSDETTGTGVDGPDDNSHIHRLDNVQIEMGALQSVPEPSALALLMGGFALLGLRRRR